VRSERLNKSNFKIHLYPIGVVERFLGYREANGNFPPSPRMRSKRGKHRKRKIGVRQQQRALATTTMWAELTKQEVERISCQKIHSESLTAHRYADTQIQMPCQWVRLSLRLSSALSLSQSYSQLT